MKIKQQKQIKEFLIQEFGNDKGNAHFVKQDKRLNELIEGTKNKTENQMKTLAQTILPRIALYQVLLESGLPQDDVNKSLRKYMIDVVAAKKHKSTAKMEKVPGFYGIYSKIFLKIMRTTDLQESTQKCGKDFYDITITKDIAALQEFGMDIVVIHSTQSKYFVASCKFELSELKLLIDAVESSEFITSKKSDALIKKIHTMISAGQVEKLKRNNYVVNRIKPDNEQIYYIIDTINEAIDSGKQISFQYYDYTGLKMKAR